MYPVIVLPVSTSPKFHSCHFAVRWTVFEIQAILRHVYRMTQIDIESYKVKLPLYVQLVPRIPNFHSVSLLTSRFLDTGHFETSALNEPKLTWNPTRSNYPIYV